MQTTDKVLMVRPVRFAYNAQTAVNNAFQESGISEELSQKEALKEFDAYVELLRKEGVKVLVVEDTPEPFTPDSIFPNNWISMHSPLEMEESDHQGRRLLVEYPMFAEDRRVERRADIVEAALKFAGDDGSAVVADLSAYERDGRFLEGTGSMVLDRNAHIAFACLSPRTDEEVIEKWADELGYDYFLFGAEDAEGNPIYHTNVMMSVGEELAVVCLDSIPGIEERMELIELLEESDRKIVEISLDQMNEFAGNMLQLKSGKGEALMVMSARAKASLDEDQVEAIERYCRIVAPDLEFIERNGGGSARCMLAEIF